MRLVYTQQARDDLRETYDYIADVLQNPTAAKSVIESIVLTCGKLEQHPNLGYSLQSKTGRESDYRCLVCGTHIAFYRVLETEVRIVRILNGRMDYMRILFEN